MHHFWDPNPPDLVVGGPDHLTYVALYLTLLVLLLSKRELVRRRRGLVRGVVLVVSLTQQSAMYAWHLGRGDGLAEGLPLHICRVCTILGLVWLLTDQDWAMQLVFYLGTYAYPSMVVPLDIPRADHAMGWSFATNHIITVLLPIFAAVTQDWAPTRAGLVRAYAAFLAYLVVAEKANAATGGNYFYLRDKPVLRALPHPTYLAATAGVTLGVFGCAYAVAQALRPRRRSRRRSRRGGTD